MKKNKKQNQCYFILIKLKIVNKMIEINLAILINDQQKYNQVPQL